MQIYTILLQTYINKQELQFSDLWIFLMYFYPCTAMRLRLTAFY